MQNKKHDLEERTFLFAKSVRDFIKQLPRNITNIEYAKQLTRSSSSVGANYIEANESLSTKDFVYRAKICRKEAKESAYWIRLVDINTDQNLEKIRTSILQEAQELTLIFGSIVNKFKNKENAKSKYQSPK